MSLHVCATSPHLGARRSPLPHRPAGKHACWLYIAAHLHSLESCPAQSLHASTHRQYHTTCATASHVHHPAAPDTPLPPAAHAQPLPGRASASLQQRRRQRRRRQQRRRPQPRRRRPRRRPSQLLTRRQPLASARSRRRLPRRRPLLLRRLLSQRPRRPRVRPRLRPRLRPRRLPHRRLLLPPRRLTRTLRMR